MANAQGLKPGMSVIMGTVAITTDSKKTIKTNELKKGDRIMLSNGWFGTIADNRKGNIRDAEIEGYFTETGSNYAHDIAVARKDNVWYVVDHTEAQIKLKQQIERMY